MFKTIFEKLKSKNYSFTFPEKLEYKNHVLKFKSFIEENNLELSPESLQYYFYQMDSIHLLRESSEALHDSMRRSLTDEWDLYLLKQAFARANTWYRENKIPSPIQNLKIISEGDFNFLIRFMKHSETKNDRVFALAFELVRYCRVDISVIRSILRDPIKSYDDLVIVKTTKEGKEAELPVPKNIFLEAWQLSDYSLDDMDESMMTSLYQLGIDRDWFKCISFQIQKKSIEDKSNLYLFELHRKQMIARSTLEKKFSDVSMQLFGKRFTLHDLAFGLEEATESESIPN